MPVDLAESESISGTEINLTVCALGNGVLCCNLAESKSLLSHFALESGMLFEGTTGVYERIYGFNSKWVRLILMAFSLDYVLISLGENWCSSLLGLTRTRRYLNTMKLYFKEPVWQAPIERRGQTPCLFSLPLCSISTPVPRFIEMSTINSPAARDVEWVEHIPRGVGGDL